MSRTTPGRVRTRFSLHPSSAGPPKSAAVRLRCCSMVPIAPSSTRIRCASNARRALADSFRLRIRRKAALLAGFPAGFGMNRRKNQDLLASHFTRVCERAGTGLQGTSAFLAQTGIWAPRMHSSQALYCFVSLRTLELLNPSHKILSEGTDLLVGTVPAKIVAVTRNVLAGKSKVGRIRSMWDGHAGKRIVEILLEW